MAWRAGPLVVSGLAAIALVWALVPVALGWLTKVALDLVSAGPVGRDDVLVLGGALAVLGLAAGLAPHSETYLRAEMDRRVGLRAQDTLFAAVERFVGLTRFEDPTFLDQLRLAHQSGGVTPGQAVQAALAVARGVVTTAGFAISLAVVNPVMAVLVLAAAVPALIAEVVLSRRRAALQWDIGPYARREIVFQQLLSTVGAAKELRLFGIGGYLRARMAAERRQADTRTRALDRREWRVQSLLAALGAGIAGAGVLWALAAAARRDVGVGDVSLFVAAVAGTQTAIIALVGQVANAYQQMLLFRHYLEVLDAGPDLPVPVAARPVAPLRHAIELRDVWFRYSPEHPWALRGVSLTIPYGQSVALVGRNGAGKSTIVKLLCRLYDPQRGAVLWDDVDVRDLDPASLRRRIGAVFQDFVAYDLTAAENIGLGDVDHLTDRQRIADAAARAGIHDTVTGLPQGYDTLLSRLFTDPDGPGTQLSGGQWQRIAVARSFLRGDRDLLILDEPSSGLDAESEHEVHAGLVALRAGRTSLLISHRLAAVRDADRLVVLVDGQIAEDGDHASLVGAGGTYARLFDLQARGYATAGTTTSREEVIT